MRRAAHVAAFIVIAAMTLNAQVISGVAGGVSSIQEPAPGQPGSPQRTPPRPSRPGEAPPKGTASIRGVVTSAGTAAPVRRAQVRAMSMEARGGGVTNTDAEGRFEIKDLPAGRYTISVSKGGFAPAQFGQRRPGDPGTPIDLADGQTAEKVSIVLSRGAVISGTVVDDGGEPVSGTQVTAVRFQYMSGTRRLMPAPSEGSSDRTDDRGGFRLYGLPPGDYFISAANRNGMMMGPGMTNTETEAFAPTYYPGTPNVSEATRITVKAGQEMSGANFALIVARMARVRGRALNSRGEPASGMAMLAPSDPFAMWSAPNMNNAMIAADGSFDFANVAPGRYNLNIRPAGMPSPASEFVVMPLTVGNEDIDNLIVSTHVGATARGVVVTDDGSAPGFRHDQVQIFPQTLEPVTMFMAAGTNRINEDYTFELTSLFDRRTFRANAGQNTGWYLKAVLFEGEDVTDTGIEFMPGRTYDGIQIVFTNKVTDLSGFVSDERGKPVLDTTVVVFPANRERWTYQSRYIRSARPDTNGRYNIRTLPPGEDYLIIAVQNLEAGQANDPEFLARAREEAKPLTLAEGETKAIDVKVSAMVP